jgi:ketopantoate reductase
MIWCHKRPDPLVTRRRERILAMVISPEQAPRRPHPLGIGAVRSNRSQQATPLRPRLPRSSPLPASQRPAIVRGHRAQPRMWGNVCFNPISTLTLATLHRVTSEPGLRALRKSMMAEAQAITTSLGLTIPEQMMERRLNAAGSVVGHKISMLQDLERGRSLETDALVTAVQEMGRLVKVPTPTIDAVLALVQERGRQAGLYDTPSTGNMSA